MANEGTARSSAQLAVKAKTFLKAEATGLLVFAISLTVYTLTLSQSHYSDAISIAVWAENPSGCLLANHVLYPWVTIFFYRAWQLLGWDGGPLLPLQVFSAIAGATAVYFMYKIALLLSNSQRPALWIAAGFGLSAGIWSYSVDIESVTTPLAVSLLFIYILLLNSKPASIRKAALLGFVAALAIATYETSACLVLAGIVGYLVNPLLEGAERFRKAALFTAFAVVMTTPIMILAAVASCGVTTWQGLVDWQFVYSSYGTWGKPSVRGTVQAFSALLRSVAGYPGTNELFLSAWIRQAGPWQRAAWAALAIVVVTALTATMIAILKKQKRANPDQRRALAVIAVWGSINSLFAWYWVPGDISFWVPTLTSWWMAVSIVCTPSPLGPSKRHKSEVVLALGVTAIAITNFMFSIHPRMSPDCSYQIAQAIKEQTDPRDLIITPGADYTLNGELSYFSRRSHISVLNWVIGFPSGDPLTVPYPRPPESQSNPRQSKEDVFRNIDTVINETKQRGGRIWLVGANPGRPEHWAYLNDQAGLIQMDFDRFHGPLTPLPCQQEMLEVQ